MTIKLRFFYEKKHEKHENCSTGVAYGSWQYRKGCSYELSPGGPWRGPQGKTRLSSEPYLASDYTTFTALRDLILYQHTHIIFLSKAEEDAYQLQDFFAPWGDSKMLKDKNGQKLSILSSWLIREYQSTGCQTLLTQAQWKKNLL